MEYVRVASALRLSRATVMWLILFICTITDIFADQYASFLKLSANKDVRFEASILTIKPMPITSCFAMCSTFKGCVYTSYQETSQLCGIHEINQPAITSLGWSIYFKRLDQAGKTAMDLKAGASTYQSSTWYSLSAGLALDGNLGTCTHTTTHYSYWMMQFGMYGVVDKVEIRMHPESVHFSRNTNRVLTVSQTFDEAVYTNGIECGSYFGEPVNSYPYMLTIQCESPIFGKFLRIQHAAQGRLRICEVFVYAP